MRRVVACLLLLFSLLLFTAQKEAKAINFKNKQMALIAYNFTLHPIIRGKMVPFEDLFPVLPPRLKRKGDPVYRHLKGLTYEMCKFQLERELAMLIMPLNSYGRRFTYDLYGYPDILIEKAQRKGDARYYIKIDMEILPSPESSILVGGDKYKDSTLNPKDYLRPQIRISISVYPRLGIVPLQTFKTSVQWQTPLLLEPTMLDGIVNSKVRYDRRTFREAIDLAVKSIVNEMGGSKQRKSALSPGTEQKK